VLGLDVPWQLQQLADAGNRAAPFAALHESGCGRLCCKSRFALVIKKFRGLQARLSCKDVRDLIASC
jgi:hypothetical protein